MIERLHAEIKGLWAAIEALRAIPLPKFVPLLTWATSGSFDGDSFSTVGKTLIDLSAIFGLPAGIKAILANIYFRDSGSATNAVWVVLSPNNTAGEGLYTYISGIPNDNYHGETLIVPCDANGDIYYQINASGASTLDLYIRIWGYWL